MGTLGEILRWCFYTVNRWYYRVAARVMRRDRLVSGSEKKFRALLESAPDAMVIVDRRGHITLVNAQAEKLFGYRREEPIGQSVGELIPESARARHRQHQKVYLKDATTRAMGHDLELRGRRKDGTEFPVEISLSPLETDQGQLVMSAIRDVTDRKLAEAQLRLMAEHDTLTGTLNRRSFETLFAEEVAAAAVTELEGGLIMLDIDALKDINDTLGHAAGDDLLRRVTVLLRAELRDTDILARFGGDEFAVILPRTTREETGAVARYLLQTIAESVLVIGSRRIRITCSAGVSSFAGGAQPEEVMLAADTALYAAKDQGRDRVVVYEPAKEEASARHVRAAWTQRLRETLDQGQLVPYQQPLLDTRLGLVTQCELLVRVLDEAGKPIPPIAFLATAERTGMVVEIDRFMVDCAIDLIRASSATARAGGPLGYAVNLSARSLAQPDLPGDIVRRIEAAGIDPRLLTFEITETVAITDLAAARAFAHPLRALGCAFALDDFGAGFASFSHLKHLPIDWLKIDGDYIRDLPRSRTDQVIVQHVARIGRELGLRTTAEFVEDRETLEMVTRYGVDAAQGYHIGRPEPVSAGAPAPHPTAEGIVHERP